MMAIAKQLSVSTRDGIYRERDTGEERAHLICKIGLARALDHQMEMIRLNRILDDAHALAPCIGNDSHNRTTDELASEVWPALHSANGDVNRMLGPMLFPRNVRKERLLAQSSLRKSPTLFRLRFRFRK